MDGSDSGRERSASAEDKKVRNREASRRFREKKKLSEQALARENASLKDEMELLRKKLATTHVDVTTTITDMHSSMRGAVEHLMKGLPDALLPNIQKALAAKANASSSVTQAVKDLVHLIPPIAYAEIHLFTMLNWYQSQRENVEPTDALLREIHRIFLHRRFRDKPVSRDQASQIIALVERVEPRYVQALANKRRLRQLLEEAAAVAAEVERDDLWYQGHVESELLRILRPEQIAARFAWFDEHMAALQDSVVGYRFDLAAPEATSPPAPPPAAAPHAAAHAHAAPGSPLRDRLAEPTFLARQAPAAPAPDDPLPAYVAAALRKRPAGPLAEAAPARRPPGLPAGVSVAPQGAGLQAELLRDLIREAVTRELTHFLDGHGVPVSSAPAARTSPLGLPAGPAAPPFLPGLYGLGGLGELPELEGAPLLANHQSLVNGFL